jgi:Tfp pilus assembly protein FimT
VNTEGKAMRSVGAELRSATGAALLDVLFTCSFIALLAAIAIPSLHASRERDAVEMAARHLASRLNLLRIEAVRRNRYVAMRFDPDDIGRYATFVDGDGDGILQNDVSSGVDAALDREAHVADNFAAVSFRVPVDVPSPDGGAVIAAESDPIRIGKSNFVTFSPRGTSTSGTLYLAGRGATQLCVRIFGATGRIRVLRFDPGTAAWRQD